MAKTKPDYTMRFVVGLVVHAVLFKYSSMSSGTDYYMDNQFANEQRLACKPPNWRGGENGYTIFERKHKQPVTCKKCIAALSV